jgi:hypothetical protein
MAAPDASEFQWPPILAACEVHLAKTGEHVLGAMCEDDPLSAELVEVRLQSPAVGVVTHLLLEEVGPADEEVDARAASRGVSVHWVSPEYPEWAIRLPASAIRKAYSGAKIDHHRATQRPPVDSANPSVHHGTDRILDPNGHRSRRLLGVR